VVILISKSDKLDQIAVNRTKSEIPYPMLSNLDTLPAVTPLSCSVVHIWWLHPGDDIYGLPTPWNCWYGELGLSSAPETLQFRWQPFGTVFQQLWDCLLAQFRHLRRGWKLSMPARWWSTSEDHLFCTLQIHSSLLLLLYKGQRLAYTG